MDTQMAEKNDTEDSRDRDNKKVAPMDATRWEVIVIWQ